MIQQGYDIIPDTGGGLFTNSRSTAAGLNTQRWAKITDAAGDNPVRYAWEEQTMQALAPGETVSIGFVKAASGITGTVNLHPVIEPNEKKLDIGDYVLIRAEYFDPVYDWVFVVQASGGGLGLKLALAKCLNAEPTSGRYDGRLQNTEPDGTLADTGASIWLRDGNNTPKLVQDDVYLCCLTGSTLGRPVYTLVDFNATVRDESLAQSYDRTLYFEFGPYQRVTITRPVDANSRRTLIYDKSIDVYDLATNTFYEDVWEIDYDSTPTTYDDTLGDRAFSYDSTTHVLTVRLNGYTGSFDYLTRCVDGVLKKRNLTFSNGLLKVVGEEEDA